ncbi:MAG: hypothetical protein COB02_12295 [Candidatus Cloacimonadota bacterium]|nr:MAG: hypothetical protein COB02_12295 [Candidatus Cloacimonadota bacterium]
MAKLFSKDENLLKSAPYIGAKILRAIQDKSITKISIFDVITKIQKANKNDSKLTVSSLYYGLIFLYSVDLIDFEASYLIKK